MNDIYGVFYLKNDKYEWCLITRFLESASKELKRVQAEGYDGFILKWPFKNTYTIAETKKLEKLV